MGLYMASYKPSGLCLQAKYICSQFCWYQAAKFGELFQNLKLKEQLNKRKETCYPREIG